MMRKFILALSLAALAPTAAFACSNNVQKADAENQDSSSMLAKKGKKSKKPNPARTSSQKG